MRRMAKLAVAAVALALAAAGCGQTAGGSQQQFTGLRIMVPNTPGGGYDVTARTAGRAMEEAKLARNVEVFNLPGAGGTVGLQRVVNEKGNGKLLMQMGLGVVGSVYTNKSKATLADTTPIARLIQEPDIVVVPKDSKYKTLDDLVTAWKANPGKLSVGGGSSPGGPDHLAPMMMANALGIAPKTVNKTKLVDLVAELRGAKEWKAALKKNGWTDAYLPGDKFGTFMNSENKRVGDVLSRLG